MEIKRNSEVIIKKGTQYHSGMCVKVAKRTYTIKVGFVSNGNVWWLGSGNKWCDVPLKDVIIPT